VKFHPFSALIIDEGTHKVSIATHEPCCLCKPFVHGQLRQDALDQHRRLIKKNLILKVRALDSRNIDTLANIRDTIVSIRRRVKDEYPLPCLASQRKPLRLT
jgi:hypothetical protein